MRLPPRCEFSTFAPSLPLLLPLPLHVGNSSSSPRQQPGTSRSSFPLLMGKMALKKPPHGKKTREVICPERTCRVSRRTMLLETVTHGATVIALVAPAVSLALEQENDPETYRTQKLSNGVKFQDIVRGEGSEAREGDAVEVNYVCRRSNGYFVHSTVDQFSGESRPVILPLDGDKIIEGLKDVLVGMKVGGKRRALIPPNVGYTSENLKPIPDEYGPRRSLLSHAAEPLVFEVQLLKIIRDAADAPDV